MLRVHFDSDEDTMIEESEPSRSRVDERGDARWITRADYHRARRGFSSDQEMADALGVHRALLVAWESGTEAPNNRNARLLLHLSVVVGELAAFLHPEVIPDWLLTEQFTLRGRTPIRALQEGQLVEVLQTVNASEHGAYI